MGLRQINTCAAKYRTFTGKFFKNSRHLGVWFLYLSLVHVYPELFCFLLEKFPVVYPGYRLNSQFSV